MRLFRLIALLDRISGEPAVVTALQEYREHTPTPPGLEPYIPPHTDDDTIGSLSSDIEHLLGDDRADDAVQLAESIVALVREITQRAVELDPNVEEPLQMIDREHQEVAAALSK